MGSASEQRAAGQRAAPRRGSAGATSEADQRAKDRNRQYNDLKNASKGVREAMGAEAFDKRLAELEALRKEAVLEVRSANPLKDQRRLAQQALERAQSPHKKCYQPCYSAKLIGGILTLLAILKLS